MNVNTRDTSWSVRTSRDRSDTETRARLLDAAEEVFARLGYARTTVADITAEAGLSRAGFYVYFASKQQAFAVLANRVRDAFLAAQEDVSGIDPDDAPAVARATTGAFIAAYARHLPLLKLIEEQAAVDEDGELAALWREVQQRPTRRTARYIRRLVADGRARPVADPLAVARAVGGMSTSFARVVADRPEEYEPAVRDVTTMYLHLLGLDPQPPEHHS